jgi:hypothetical protein
MTINSVTQSQALASAHALKGPQAQRGANPQGAVQGRPAPGTDGDGDHGIEPPKGGTGNVVNLKG